MMIKSISTIAFLISLIALTAGTPVAVIGEKLECHWSEVEVMGGSCDGTCENPAPTCIFTKILKPRCGCPPGHVRNGPNCIKIFRCENRSSVMSQCQHEKIFNAEISCDEEGLYELKQTVGGVSKCVVPETGATIPGKINEAGGRVDCSVMEMCQKDYIEMHRFHYHNVMAMDGPNVQCSSSGQYRRRQCTSFTSNCRCVVPQTGTAIPGLEWVGPRFKCKKSTLTACQERFVEVDMANAESEEGDKQPLPECSAIDGKYPASECDAFGICTCRNRDTGAYLPGTGARITCEVLTECQKQFAKGGMRMCDDDGRFDTIECNQEEDSCHCVDPNTGAVDQSIPSVPFAQARELKCPALCPSNMEYHRCAGCDTTCSNKDQLFMCTMQCRMKCVCPHPMVWSADQEKCINAEECEPEIIIEPPPLPDIPVPVMPLDDGNLPVGMEIPPPPPMES